MCKTKKGKWKQLCEHLNSNIFGYVYEIVKAQLEVAQPKVDVTAEKKKEVFEELFISGRKNTGVLQIRPEPTTEFTT